MDTKALEKFCPWARIELIDTVHLRCAEYGLDDEGREAFPAGSDMVAGNVLGTELKALRDAHYESIEHMGYAAFLEHQAYSWFNRFAAIRYMELHDFLPSHIRMVSSSTGDMYPDCVRAVAELELEGLNRAETIDLAIAGENEKLYRSIILAQCRELTQALPSVFAGADELTLPNNLLGHGEHDVLHHLVADIPEEAWENVEVLGWMYQFYNSELKDKFFKSKHKAMAEDIPPATQLFTPDWIVRYMVENSLGRLWMLNNPGSRLRERMEYYIEPDEGHEDFIRVNGPEDITFCDPACGSGHILVYAFGLLFQMYTERGYRERDIPALILTKNLTGFEIDDRAAQIASLALALCAREHDRRFLTRGVTADIQVLRGIEFDEGELPEFSALVHHRKDKLVESLAHLSEIGSLLTLDAGDLGCIRDDAETCANTAEKHGDLLLAGTAAKLAEARSACEALARTFDVVVANPPYMGSSSFNPFMSKWMKKHYPDSCKDLCTAFIERGYALAAERGYAAMVTMQSWMFLGSFKKMRNALIDGKSIVTMAHLGPRAFDAIGGEVVSVTADVIYNDKSSSKGAYFRLVDVIGSDPKREKLVEAIQNPNCGWFYRADAATFHDIPGSPIAYWASESMRRAFTRGKLLDRVAQPKQGLATSDDKRFIRTWWETSFARMGIGLDSKARALQSGLKWFPCVKGGGFRRWGGASDFVLNWMNDGEEMKETVLKKYPYLNTPDFVLKNQKDYFKAGITWGFVSSSRFSMRNVEHGCIPTVAGSMCYPEEEAVRYLLGLMNSSVVSEMFGFIAPTLNFTGGDVGKIPVIQPSEKLKSSVDPLVHSSIKLSQADWDTQETSWDFKRSPLI